MYDRGQRTLMHRVVSIALSIAAVLLGFEPRNAEAQDPVTKPPTTTTLDRLPRPTTVTAKQQTDGRILLTWTPVDGATKYRIMRSVPPTPVTVVTNDPDQTDTTYLDADVKAGSTYYYTVAASNDAGAIGLSTGTSPVTATISAGSTVTTTPTAAAGPQTISAAVQSAVPAPTTDAITVTYSAVTGASSYKVEAVRYPADNRDPTQPLLSNPQATTFGGETTALTTQVRVPRERMPQFLQFKVTPQLASGPGMTVVAAVVRIQPQSVVINGAPVTLKVGASFSPVPTYGDGYIWLSMNQNIASVENTGFVGRSLGSIGMVGLKSYVGSVEVVHIDVRVIP